MQQNSEGPPRRFARGGPQSVAPPMPRSTQPTRPARPVRHGTQPEILRFEIFDTRPAQYDYHQHSVATQPSASIHRSPLIISSFLIFFLSFFLVGGLAIATAVACAQRYPEDPALTDTQPWTQDSPQYRDCSGTRTAHLASAPQRYARACRLPRAPLLALRQGVYACDGQIHSPTRRCRTFRLPVA